VYTPVDCDDQDACTTDTCDPATGCVYTPVDCDDDDACTVDICNPATGCVYTPVDCDDQDACTTDSCDPATGCVYTPVDCDDDDACTTDTCDPATGCVYTPVDCDDEDACTTDTCDPAIGCVYTPVDCDDDDACTADTCDPATGCVYTPVVCDDGDVCNGLETCDPATGNCIPGTPLTCDDGDVCNGLETCDPVSGCQPGTPLECDDEDLCTTDTCDPLTGCVYTPVECDDGDPCTIDSCNPVTGCVNTPVDAEVTCPAEALQFTTESPATLLSVVLPEGGVYSGPGVTNGIFDPASVGVGTYVISYDYTYYGTECVKGCTFNIQVTEPPRPDLTLDKNAIQINETPALEYAAREGTEEDSPVVDDTFGYAFEYRKTYGLFSAQYELRTDMLEQITYEIVVTNTGNVTLLDVRVEDPQVGLSETIASLAPGASEIFTVVYTPSLTQEEVPLTAEDVTDVTPQPIINTATAVFVYEDNEETRSDTVTINLAVSSVDPCCGFNIFDALLSGLALVALYIVSLFTRLGEIITPINHP
jgi:hypothetical protein